MTNNQKRVYKITASIPSGFVLAYKKLAQLARVKNPRVVGNILHKNADPVNIPCHRVVHSDGSLAETYAFGGIKAQEEKLRQEGIKFINRKIDLDIYLWRPNKLKF